MDAGVFFGLVGIGALLIALGAIAFSRPPSFRSHPVPGWLAQTYPAALFGEFPAGIACIILAVDFGFTWPDSVTSALLWLGCVLGLSSIVFFYWSPAWARPPWAR